MFIINNYNLVFNNENALNVLIDRFNQWAADLLFNLKPLAELKKEGALICLDVHRILPTGLNQIMRDVLQNILNEVCTKMKFTISKKGELINFSNNT